VQDTENVRRSNRGYGKSQFTTFESPTEQDAVGWVSVMGETVTIPPQRTRVLRAKIVVPRDTPADASVTRAIRVHARAMGQSDEPRARTAEAAVLIVASGPKALPAGLEVVTQEIVRGSSGVPTLALASIKNTGGRLAKAWGEMSLSASGGQAVATMQIPATWPRLILPGAVQEFRLPIPPLYNGEYTFSGKLTPGQPSEGAVEFEESFSVETGISKELFQPTPEPEPLKGGGSESTASGAALTEE